MPAGVFVEGKCGIKATILADSVTGEGTFHPGVRLVTLEIEYPRIILAELNTHRMLSKNTASSRAIPFNTMVENLNGRPVRFGQANSGMQDKGVEFIVDGFSAEKTWNAAKNSAIKNARKLYENQFHKQT